MRILEVCPYDLTRPGGVQRHVLDLSAALARAGHAVHIVAPPPADASRPAPSMEGGVAIHALGASRRWRMHGTAFEVTWVPGRELEGFVGARGATAFDVVHVHTPFTPFLPWQVLRRLGDETPAVATFHDTLPPGASGRVVAAMFGALGRRLARRLAAVIAVSESAASYLRRDAGCPFFVLPPCVDLSRYRALRGRPVTQRPPTILFVGRLEPRKGLAVLIDAFVRLHAQRPEVRLVVCGDGAERPAAQGRVAAAGVGAAVRFTGELPEEQKLALYAAADVLCAPSLYGESYGLVIAEAMAAGLPVVAAANAGYRKLLEGEGAAGLVPPGDAAALAARLSEVLASASLRRALSGWGQARSAASDVSARLADFLAVFDAARRPVLGVRKDLDRDSAARAGS